MPNESKTATLVFICDYAHLKQGDKGTYSKSLAAEIVRAGVAIYEGDTTDVPRSVLDTPLITEQPVISESEVPESGGKPVEETTQVDEVEQPEIDQTTIDNKPEEKGAKAKKK